MMKACLGMGAPLYGMMSGMWSLSQSQGDVWLPLMIAIAGVLPIAAGWASAFVNGESAPR